MECYAVILRAFAPPLPEGIPAFRESREAISWGKDTLCAASGEAAGWEVIRILGDFPGRGAPGYICVGGDTKSAGRENPPRHKVFAVGSEGGIRLFASVPDALAYGAGKNCPHPRAVPVVLLSSREKSRFPSRKARRRLSDIAGMFRAGAESKPKKRRRCQSSSEACAAAVARPGFKKVLCGRTEVVSASSPGASPGAGPGAGSANPDPGGRQQYAHDIFHINRVKRPEMPYLPSGEDEALRELERRILELS